MAKTKTKAAPKPKTAQRQAGRLSLGDAGSRYAKLLANPCTADLCNGPFGDGFGGLVARFEREYVINNSATDVAAFVGYTPATGVVCINATPITDATTALTPTGLLAASNPGYSFLSSNASAVRPLAACMQIYWPGSELNRQGIVSLGRHNAEIYNDATLSVDGLRTQANYIKRMPDDMFEIVWRPTERDLMGQDWGPTIPPLAQSSFTTLVGTATGIPVSTGIRIRIVAVYEWMPDPASGFKNVIVKSVQPHRLADILAALDRAGDWMSGTAHSAGRAISSLAGGVASIMSFGNGATRIGRALIGV
jgi:hypothetical protein